MLVFYSIDNLLIILQYWYSQRTNRFFIHRMLILIVKFDRLRRMLAFKTALTAFSDYNLFVFDARLTSQDQIFELGFNVLILIDFR